MLPSRGVSHSVYLLSYAAQVAPRKDLDEWVNAAFSHGGFLAAATDLVTPAKQLLECELARLAGDQIEVSSQLLCMLALDSSMAIREIAQVILLASPPSWLRFAVIESKVFREYIPEDDLKALKWLEPDLDKMLILAHKHSVKRFESAFRKAIGDAAELFIFAALQYSGVVASHVALFTDALGYDIEVITPYRKFVEVKACGPGTSDQFYLTRNEFEACRIHRDRWLLVQVVFNGSAFTEDVLDASSVLGIFELEPDRVLDIVPQDTSNFSWADSALLRPPEDWWQESTLVLDPDFQTTGFRMR